MTFMRGSTGRAETLSRPMMLVGATFVLSMTMAGPADACAVCYGDAESGLTQGVKNGILVLLGIVAVVQIGFVALFLSFRQRARQIAKQEERIQLIQGGAG